MIPIEGPGPTPTVRESEPPAVAAEPTLPEGLDGAVQPATSYVNKIEPAAGPADAGAKSMSVPGLREPELPAIDDDPERLMGVGTAELTRILGDPRFVRRDSNAQLWRYRNETCILDLFLYRKAGQPEYLVSHVESRRLEGGSVPTHECFEKLLLDRRDGRTG